MDPAGGVAAHSTDIGIARARERKRDHGSFLARGRRRTQIFEERRRRQPLPDAETGRDVGTMVEIIYTPRPGARGRVAP
ncbi:MAG TPA: hypothetical protein VFQ07_03725 [Candidatus Polarisedimenticolia bacterium]|nr:hypothetical protein [Candidatus Polarisedimenticolia bacterium]